MAETSGAGPARQRVHFKCEGCGEWSTVWTYTPDLALYDLHRAHVACPPVFQPRVVNARSQS